jgi:preprotein translocase subunit SecG
MTILLTVLHVVVCLFLIIVVLLQSGKAADLAGAFGGMGSQTAFGPRGSATVLSKATTIAAALFMVTSLSLSVMHTREGGGAGSSGSVLEKSAPATPAGQQTPAQKGQATPVGKPGEQVPVQMGKPGEPVAPGQPSVTIGEEGGKQVTVPLKIGKQPEATKQTTPPPAAPKK